jgi:hypothetical protein
VAATAAQANRFATGESFTPAPDPNHDNGFEPTPAAELAATCGAAVITGAAAAGTDCAGVTESESTPVTATTAEGVTTLALAAEPASAGASLLATPTFDGSAGRFPRLVDRPAPAVFDEAPRARETP